MKATTLKVPLIILWHPCSTPDPRRLL